LIGIGVSAASEHPIQTDAPHRYQHDRTAGVEHGRVRPHHSRHRAEREDVGAHTGDERDRGAAGTQPLTSSEDCTTTSLMIWPRLMVTVLVPCA
jgi:hypothetical protein